MSERAAFLEVWGTILLAVLVLTAFVIAAGKLQRWLLARAAGALGLAILPGPRPFTEEEAENRTLLRLFNSDSRRGARGVVQGIDTALFDHDITLEWGFHSTPKIAHQTVAALRASPDAEIEFVLEPYPRGEWSKPHDGQKPVLDAPPEFLRRYRLSTKHPEEVRRLLVPAKLEFLAQLAEKESWTIWCGDGWFVLYQQGRTVSNRKLGHFLEKAQAIVSTLTAAQQSARP
jgi:hypothetical protein